MQLSSNFSHISLLALILLSIAGCTAQIGSEKALKDDWRQADAVNYNSGLDAYNRKDYATALENWKPLAEKGFAKAQINLALMYSTGRGVPTNHKEALRWNLEAAKQGYPVAQNNMGVMYQYGQGVTQDNAEAERWYTLAAEQEYTKAKENLAKLSAQTSIIPGETIDVTGTYVSDITSNSSDIFPNEYRSINITLKQNGNNVTGEDSSSEFKISGIRDGDIINFTTGEAGYYKCKCTFIDGFWKINADGRKLEGLWDRGGGAKGKWNLTRIE